MLPNKLIRFLRLLPNCWQRARELSSKIGMWGALKLQWILARSERCQSGLWQVSVRGWPQPIYGRYGTSDLRVFLQIFDEQEHAPVVDVLRSNRSDEILILDCGANVGYASIFFLIHFPSCMITAVEPDTENFLVLQTNLQGFGPRVTLVNQGLWSHHTMLGCGNLGFRDGQHWGRQVYKSDAGDPDARPSVTIKELLANSGRHRIDLLKMDIEGAEAEVFAKNYSDWLDCTDVIAIELHDDSDFGSSNAVFRNAIAGQGFGLKKSGELTIACRTTRPALTTKASIVRNAST